MLPIIIGQCTMQKSPNVTKGALKTVFLGCLHRFESAVQWTTQIGGLCPNQFPSLHYEKNQQKMHIYVTETVGAFSILHFFF